MPPISPCLHGAVVHVTSCCALLTLQFDETIVHPVQLGREALDLGLQSADLSGR
jgi:hypothetical protein